MYPGAIVVFNTNEDYYTAIGELLEGRRVDFAEAATFAGNSYPEMNVYMYKPGIQADEGTLRAEYNRARSVGAYFAYAPGPLYFTNTEPDNIWPDYFDSLISVEWKQWLNSLGIV